MLSAADQIDRIVTAPVSSGGMLLSGGSVTVGDDDLSAYGELSLEYPNGHRLHMTLALDVTYGHPAWALYAFQFQDRDRQTIFRYDNWPHHPEVETFPHHKHVGSAEEIQAHPQPSLASLIREIGQYT